MFSYSKNLVDDTICEDIADAIKRKGFDRQARHFISSGKTFFTEDLSAVFLLSTLTQQIAERTNVLNIFGDPYIDHAFLLLKSPGGNQTPPHQDRPFWTDLEDDVTMITCWLSLNDIPKNQGALQVFSKEAVEFEFFNDTEQTLFDHIAAGEEESGNFSYVIPQDVADSLRPNTILTKKGDVIFFDAYEVHASEPNSSQEIRLALKIVFRDGGGLWPVRKLIKSPTMCFASMRAKYYIRHLRKYLGFASNGKKTHGTGV